MKTKDGIEYNILDASYLSEIESRMPFHAHIAKCHIANCGIVIVYADKNEYFDCYEPIDNEYYLNEIYLLFPL